jgi:hypothetical protein
LRQVGVGLPWSEEMGRRVHTESNGGRHWFKLVCPHRGWAGWLGGSGIPFALHSQAVNALCGAGVWAFSDEELRAWLAGGLLLDATAAAILLERGLGEYIGLSNGRMVTQADFPYSSEYTLDAAFGLRVGAGMNVNTFPYAARLLQGDLLPGARMVSDLRGPTNDVLGHGVTLFENALGGRVAVAPWDANAAPKLSPQRAVQLAGVVRYLDPRNTAGRVDGGAWLIPQFLTDGDQWRAAIWNASPDELDQFTFTLPAGMPHPTHATQITGSGEMLPARVEGDTVRLERPLYEWELVVLR